MSEEQIGELTAGLAEVKAVLDERSRQSNNLRGWIMCLVGAFVLQASITLFYAGGKSERLDRAVADVQEIKARVYQIRP